MPKKKVDVSCKFSAQIWEGFVCVVNRRNMHLKPRSFILEIIHEFRNQGT